MTFGLTPQGFFRKRLPNSKAEQEDVMISLFGNVNTVAQSVFGQLIGNWAKADADAWEIMEDVYFSQYPNTAEGVSLDYVVALNGITRLPALQTRVTVVAGGTESTLIPQGTLARQANTGQIFSALENASITRSRSALANVEVDAIIDSPYGIQINSSTFNYNLPKIEFDDIFSGGDEIDVTINGTPLAQIPFNTDSQTTIEDVAAAIQALDEVSLAVTRLGLVITFDADFVTDNIIDIEINGDALTPIPFDNSHADTLQDVADAINNDPNVTSATVTGARQITIVPLDPGTFLVNQIEVTMGSSQANAIHQRIDVISELGEPLTVNSVTTNGPNATISFLAPSSEVEILDHLSALINNSSEPVDTEVFGNIMQILANDSDIPFSLNISTGLIITLISSPMVFIAQNFGPVPAPADSVNEIVNPISGWDFVTNFKDGLIGRNRETDAELRLRRQNSIRILGAATVESIRARIAQEVLGVTHVSVYENRTMQEENIEITFSADFSAGNDIVVTINGIPLPVVSFTTDHVTTMQLLAAEIQQFNGIDTVNVGGLDDRVLTIVMDQGYQIDVEDIQITGPTVNYHIIGGRYPKSFEAIVQGGSDLDVAEKIWQVKPAGIQTFGNTQVIVNDSQGDPQAINFSRPVPIYIWVNVELTLYDEEDFPINGLDLVRQEILEYGNSLLVGEDVIIQRILCQVFHVPGISNVFIEIASTLDPGDTPTYDENNIPIENSEVAVFDLNRITASVV